MRRGDDRFQQALGEIVKPPMWLDRVLKKRIVIHLVNDQSIQGVLMERVDDGLILRAAELLAEGGKATPMAGETWVPREKVAFAQLDE